MEFRMKLTRLSLLAAALAGSIAAAAPALAQHHVEVQRTTRTVSVTRPRRLHRPRQVCETRVYHHRRVRHCYRR